MNLPTLRTDRVCPGPDDTGARPTFCFSGVHIHRPPGREQEVYARCPRGLQEHAEEIARRKGEEFREKQRGKQILLEDDE